MLKRILILIAMVLAATASYAADFTAQAHSPTVQVCSCGSAADSITIQNTDTQPAQYLITLSGPLEPFASLSTNDVILQPNEVRQINLFAGVPCGRSGTFPLSVHLQSASKTETLDYAIEAVTCQNLKVSGVELNKTACIGDGTTYEFTLENTATFTEEYLLEIEKPLRKWATLDAGYRIQPGQTAHFSVNITPDIPEGDYTSDLHIRTKHTDLAAIAPLQLEVGVCYDYNVALSKIGPTFKTKENTSYEVCESENSSIPLLFTNTLSTNKTLTLTLEGPSWITANREEVVLKGSENKLIRLQLNVPRGTTGRFAPELIITSEGDPEQRQRLDLSVHNCYLPHTTPDVFNVPYGAHTSGIDIRNTGSDAAQYSLKLEGPPWAELQETALEVEPGESQTISFVSTPTDRVGRGDYAATLLLTAQNDGVYEIPLTIKVDVTLASQLDNLYAVAVSGYGLYVGIGILFVVLFVGGWLVLAKTRPKRVKETKKEKGRKAEKKFKIKVEKPKKKQKKYVIRIQWKAIWIAFATLLAIGAAATYFNNPDLFRLPTFESPTNQTETQPAVPEGPEEPTEPEEPEELPVEGPTEEPPVVGEPKEEPIEERYLTGIQPITINKNEESTVNLNEYFTDPDQDVLQFAANNTDNLDITYRRGVATITPKTDFVGREAIVFTATDAAGESIESNEVLIIVQDTYISPFSTFIETYIVAYWLYYLVGIALLVIIIFLVHFRKNVMKFLEEEK